MFALSRAESCAFSRDILFESSEAWRDTSAVVFVLISEIWAASSEALRVISACSFVFDL
jgi:hypothetical protein